MNLQMFHEFEFVYARPGHELVLFGVTDLKVQINNYP